MSAAKKDVDAAVEWLTTVAVEVMRRALAHEGAATRLVDKVTVITACASLPGDMPLRVRLTPRVFTLVA